MSEDSNLELLEITHTVTSQAEKLAGMLDDFASAGDIIPMTPTTLELTAALLRTQNRIIRGLTEQNQEIVDHVDALVNRLTKQ